RIEHIGTVSGGHQDYAIVRFEAVHFDQQLVQSLFALVVPATQTRAAVTSYGVNFVNKDDAGGILLALLKQIAHAARAHADKHFDEVRTGDRKEGDVGFAGDGPRQQGFTCSRRANQQHALGNASAQLLKLLRLTQELNDFVQLFFGLIHASHVFERDLFLLHGEQARAAFTERQRLVAARLHLADHEEPERAQQDQRREVQNPARPGPGAG